MTLVYVLKRFPKISETFILQEIAELIRQGERVAVFALLRPHAGEPWHAGSAELASHTVYLPTGPPRAVALLWASLLVLLTSPARSTAALAVALRWSLQQRRMDHLKRFGEAAYIQRRVPAQADHIHAHFAHGPATVALLLSRMAGVPFSFTGHARDIFELTPSPILADKMARARFVVTVSKFTREHLRGIAHPIDRDKVVVVRNGLNASSFSPRGGDPDGVPLLLSVGRLVEKKGQDTLLEACALLRDRGLVFRVEVVGEGPQRARLEDAIHRLGLNGHVALLGSRDRDEVRAAYDRAHVFVLPCRQTSVGDRDGLPVAIVEAMAVGVPVVTTPVAGIPELVGDGVSGILVPPDDPARLAEAVERVLTDRALRSRLVVGGRTVASRYDLRESVTRLRKLFHNFPTPPEAPLSPFGGGQGEGPNSPPPPKAFPSLFGGGQGGGLQGGG